VQAAEAAAGGVNFAAIGPDGKVAAGTGTYATGRDAAGRPTIVGHTKLDYGALKTSEGTPYAVTRETSTNAPGVAVEQITVAGEGTGTIVTRERDWTDDKLRNAAYSISQLGNEVAPEQYVRLERAHGLRHGVAQEMHRNYQSSLASGMGQAEALETMQRSIRNMQGRQVETTIGNVRLQDNPSSGIYGVQKSEVESAVAEIASKTDVNRVRSEGAAYLKSIGVDDTTAKMFIESLQKSNLLSLGATTSQTQTNTEGTSKSLYNDTSAYSKSYLKGKLGTPDWLGSGVEAGSEAGVQAQAGFKADKTSSTSNSTLTNASASSVESENSSRNDALSHAVANLMAQHWSKELGEKLTKSIGLSENAKTALSETKVESVSANVRTDLDTRMVNDLVHNDPRFMKERNL